MRKLLTHPEVRRFMQLFKDRRCLIAKFNYLVTIRNIWLLEIISKSQVISLFIEPIAS